MKSQLVILLILVSSLLATTADVYCDMDTSDGGWSVVQKNIKDGVNTFNRTWKDYEEGFGDLKSSKFWYGLKALYCFTQTGQWELRIDFQFENQTWSHIHYNSFSVGSASGKYQVTTSGFTGTTPTDPFVDRPHNGMKFTTIDNDNDNYSSGNCALNYSSGWWYNKCYHIDPNHQPPRVILNSKLYNLLSIEMKIRPLDCIIV